MSVKTKGLYSLGIFLLLLLIFWGAGCATSSSTPPPTQATLQKDASGMPTYYDFADVMIPSELSLVRKESFVYASAGTTAGVLTLKGRVDRESLYAFFENNMAKDNWRLISSFRAPKAMLLFQKENRWCIVSVEDDVWNELVKVWVAPTVSGATSGLMK